jgi:Family of unknown function (DUF5723)
MKKLYTALLTFLAAATAQGQYNLGVSGSNWAGMTGLYMNPANIADSREKFVVDVIGLNVGVNNSLGTINSNGGLIGAINGGNTNNLFAYSGGSKFSMLAPYGQVHLPGIMVSINHKHSIALTAGIQGFNQFNNFDQSLYRTLADPTYTSDGNINLTSNKFNYTAQLWSQLGLSYGGVVFENDEHEIKVGATLRYLGGIGYIGLKGHNLDAHYYAGTDSVYVSKSDIEYASNLLSTKSAILNGVSNNNILSEFFGSKDGSGIGGDIGVVYEWDPNCCGTKSSKKDHSRNHYLLRFSASVMDIGHITYKAANNSNAEVTGNGSINGNDFSAKVKNFDEFKSYAVAHGFTADTAHLDTKVYMPTTLRIGTDYHAYEWLYINATFIGNLANRQDFGNSYYNQFTVTPRFDARHFSLGIPFTYDALTSSMKTGIGVRYSGLYFGSDDMMAFFTNHQTGLNFYIGGFVAVNKKAPKTVDTAAEQPEPDMEHGGSPDTVGSNGNGAIHIINEVQQYCLLSIEDMHNEPYADNDDADKNCVKKEELI